LDTIDRVASSSADSKLSVDDLAGLLQERILSGAIPTGTWLRQERIATEFGVSRTPVREALRGLQAQGMVEVVPNRGALVCGPTARDIREAYAVRAQLEGYAAELAAEWVRDDQLKRMNEAEEIFERSAAEASEIEGDGRSAAFERPEWSRANDLFHEAILDAAGNLRLKDTVRALHRSFPRNVTWSTLSGNRRLLQENVEQHRAIASAIAQRDPVAAKAAMLRHVQRSGELVALRYEQLQPS
jgi:DNA-binding GntR family transcriptional regulator